MGEENQETTPPSGPETQPEVPQPEVEDTQPEEAAPTEPAVTTGTADTTEPDRDKDVRAAQDAELEAERQERKRQLG